LQVLHGEWEIGIASVVLATLIACRSAIPMRLTLHTINTELAKRGHMARLAKASDYFYFHLGEAADWLDRAVRVPTLSSLTLEKWLAEFEKLKKVNAELFRPAKGGKKRQAGGSKMNKQRE
jgi:hypothetical protein